MPDGQRATNGAVKASTANGSAYPNGTANGSAQPNGTAKGNGNGKMTLDKPYPSDEKAPRPRVVDPEWGDLTLKKARAKLVSDRDDHHIPRAPPSSPERISGSTVC